MSLLTTEYQYPSSLRVTRPDIVKRFIRDMENAGAYGTATGGSANTLIDTTTLQSGMYSDEMFETGFIWVYSTTDGLAPQGQIRPVSDFIVEEGKLVVSPPFTAAVGAGDLYVVTTLMHPQRMFDLIDDLLTQNLWLSDWAFCSECPDGDMEQPTAVEWTAAANTTVSKQTADPLMGGGVRYLKVLNSGGTNGYSYNAAELRVEPGKQFHMSALTRCDVGATSHLQAWDDTNNVLIDEITVSRLNNVRIYKNFTVPANCNLMRLRLQTYGPDGAASYWKDVVFYPLGVRNLRLPYWVENGDQVKQVYKFSPGAAPTQDGVWLGTFQGSIEKGWEPQARYDNGGMELHSQLAATSMPLYIWGMRHAQAFASDTETKPARADWVQAGLAFKVFKALKASLGAESSNTKWVDSQLAICVADWTQQKYIEKKRIEDQMQAPPQQAGFTRSNAPGVRQSTWPSMP